ncbi:unnamed protein product [Rotaria magnacalcarata]|uniref:Isopenicillin N synthase-like Fe(2+) 2OG dioxygenase domain-containing protein n=2 Tax=Rotaria magnacalcarata TaxID=392030 RepID=A0A816EUA5_9BILA|nr:unnamed protein product [Rotaria magnacalcarata]CAF1650617.1 unnamed protein product [Rotaria magnacalcarata]CAF4073798.1 unnamed protein product [Rotaria magnacalcarata]CAF4305415.1 unnamed protein product [Rotaria magnacalcarata]
MSALHKKSQVIIDLNKILNYEDTTEIKRMETEFESNGWCFVLLPNELILNSNLTKKLLKFFEFYDAKSVFSQRQQIYGYSKVNHKEGIKLLTGSYFGQFASKALVPITLIQPLNYLSQVFDAVTKRLIELLDQNSVFQQEPSLLSLIERADLPLQDEHFGMLDIVNYFNVKSGFQPPKDGQTTEEVNCVPHYDPGLLSISILSTHEGLQLKNLISNEWVDEPLETNMGVIWLGETASRITENRLKAGIHRVIYPQVSKSRLTIWYELCTIEQLKNLSTENKNEVMNNGTVTFKNLPWLPPMTVSSGETKIDFLKRVEISAGLSMSKTGPPTYQLEKHVITYPITGWKDRIKNMLMYAINVFASVQQKN